MEGDPFADEIFETGGLAAAAFRLGVVRDRKNDHSDSNCIDSNSEAKGE